MAPPQGRYPCPPSVCNRSMHLTSSSDGDLMAWHQNQSMIGTINAMKSSRSSTSDATSKLAC
eukprot:134435-Pelagomonas_calceolata.AAC.1